MKQVKLWLEPLDDTMFLERSRQNILNAMKGQEPEKNLITLLPVGFSEKLRDKFPHENIEEKVREKFQKAIEPFVKGTLKEKTLSREEMEQLLVRKLLELTNPNSEYDILFFRKVTKSCKPFVLIFI